MTTSTSILLKHGEPVLIRPHENGFTVENMSQQVWLSFKNTPYTQARFVLRPIPSENGALFEIDLDWMEA